MKLNDDKYINQVVFIKLPNVKHPKWYWIVRKTDDNKYIVRAPKINILIKKLKYKRDDDFKKEIVLPNGSIIDPFGKLTKKWKNKNKNKTKKTRKSIKKR